MTDAIAEEKYRMEHSNPNVIGPIISNENDSYLSKLEKEIEKLREKFLKEMNVSKANKLLNEMNDVSEKVLILKHRKKNNEKHFAR